MIGGACSCQEIERMLQDFLAEFGSIAGGSGKRSSGKKRAPSAYNRFIGECTSGGKKTMKECAVDWKQIKQQ